MRKIRSTTLLQLINLCFVVTFLIHLSKLDRFLLSNKMHLNRDQLRLSQEKFLEVQVRMTARRNHLMRECAKSGLDGFNYTASAWEFLINRQFHLVWCNIFKAASTSWMYNFNLMANYTEKFLKKTKAVPMHLARKKYPRPTLRMVRNAQMDSITFLIVRHPLERLASAYNDKIVHPTKKTMYHWISLKIRKRYREKRNLETNNSTPKVKHPLFEEFVSYVLDTSKNRPLKLDMHWMPYNSFCTPCKFHWDVILKFETLDEDQQYLLELAHLHGVIKAEWLNKGPVTTSYKNLYSRISRDQLDGLYELYMEDFHLFNYSIDEYYNVLDKAGVPSTKRSIKNLARRHFHRTRQDTQKTDKKRLIRYYSETESQAQLFLLTEKSEN